MVSHIGNLIIHFFFQFLLQVTKDAVHGSEAGKAISFYVLDALISIDHEKYFLNQLQSRGILRSCLSDVTNYLSKVCTATALSLLSSFFHFSTWWSQVQTSCYHAFMLFWFYWFSLKWISFCGLLFLIVNTWVGNVKIRKIIELT